MQMTDKQVSQIDRVQVEFQGTQADLLPDERPANKTQASLPFDVAAAAHPSYWPAKRIAQCWQLRRIAAVTGSIFLGRGLMPQGLMRPLRVESLDERIEAGLLLEDVG